MFESNQLLLSLTLDAMSNNVEIKVSYLPDLNNEVPPPNYGERFILLRHRRCTKAKLAFCVLEYAK